MLEGTGRAVIARSPRDIMEFVLDIERYRKADRKFGRIVWVRREGNRGAMRYSGRLRGLPTPTDTQEFVLADDCSELTFRSTDKFWPNVVAPFFGSFTCRETPEGTEVVHREVLAFRRPFSWLAVPLLRRWWQREIRDEVVRMKDILEAG